MTYTLKIVDLVLSGNKGRNSTPAFNFQARRKPAKLSADESAQGPEEIGQANRPEFTSPRRYDKDFAGRPSRGCRH